jgi:hypothetical protein
MRNMEDVPEIKPVELYPEEVDLFKQMEAEFSKSSGYTGQAASRLMESLRTRKAIPAARIHYFTKPYPGGRGKSHQDVLRSGSYRDNMFTSPYFVKYLRYFIKGPDLPTATIEGFRKILSEDLGTSGMIMDQLCTFVRAEVRKLRLDSTTARDEFWKLAKEVGYSHAETIRNAAGSAA